MGKTIFADRDPTPREFERFRLIFSTYQDGTGMLARPNGTTLPGWRDFERSVAYAFGGRTTENKSIFDVYIPYHGEIEKEERLIGLSCKMRRTLRDVRKKGKVTIEVSNALGTFWNALKAIGISEENIIKFPRKAAEEIFKTIYGWHGAVGVEMGGNVCVEKSYYLVLQWDDKSSPPLYQMFLFPLRFPDIGEFVWKCDGRRLVGKRRSRSGGADDVVFEWYYFSGGQFKYYPSVKESLWTSSEFVLEPLPKDLEIGVVNKAKVYFPGKWREVE